MTKAKSVMIPLGLITVKRPDATTLITSNEEMKDIMKVVKFLKDSDKLIKGVTQTIENETKEQKDGFLCIGEMKDGA